ncbi:MAG: s-methyl-5-thioribose-1-phosphate isomerase [Treponema sp.]
MERKDSGLAFLLHYENVAWFEKGCVRILDRRSYPEKIEYVECRCWQEVRQAITDMVTQSAGPYTAAAMGMALAAYQVRSKPVEIQKAFLEEAAGGIAHARPTTANRMGLITANCLAQAVCALDAGEDAAQAIFTAALESLNRRYGIMEKVGEYLASLFPHAGAILTQCFGETIVGMMLKAARSRGNPVRLICAETRPFLQGARLTASCAADMGFEVTVITDNMVAYTMQHQNIGLFTSAADSITQDGHIANKIGTFQIALLAAHFGVPYYVTGIPDADKKTAGDICIEQRNPDEVLSFRGVRHTHPAVKGLYPSFDITPPELITGVVTDKGVYLPQALKNYFTTPQQQFY